MINDVIRHKTEWKITKYANDEDFKNNKPYEISEFEGNVLLNEGITALMNLLIGAAETAYAQASSWLGVGNGVVAEGPTDTGLGGASKFYQPCDASYPTVVGQVSTWRGIFGTADGNFDWEEFTVSNTNSDTGDNLNRKTSTQGTKAAGQTWTLDLAITWS